MRNTLLYPKHGKVHEPPGVTPQQQEWAEALAAEYMDVITTGMASHERSLQRLIGPSEIGVPCDRALINKLDRKSVV